MKKFTILLIVSLAAFCVVCLPSCENKYEAQCEKYWNDYDTLFLEIVLPSLEIEDGDEFMDYYTREEIITKIEQAEKILDEIYKIKIEHNLTKMPVSYSSLTVLKNMITAKERYKDIEDKYIRTYPINGSIGVKSQLKRFVSITEESIENYNKYMKKR